MYHQSLVECGMLAGKHISIFMLAFIAALVVELRD
jgi:hypothetical protein